MPRSTAPHGGLRGYLDRLGPAGLLFLITLVLFAAILIEPSTRVTATSHGQLHGDVSLHLWQYFWLGRFLEGAEPLLRTRMLLFPAEVNLVTLWEGHLDLLLAAPLVTTIGLTSTSSLVALAFTFGAALAVAYLAGRTTGSRWSAAIAASLFLLSPPVLHEVAEGRAEILSLALIAPALVHARAWFLEGRPRDLAIAALFTVLCVCGYLAAGPLLVVFVPVLGACALPAILAARRAGADSWARPSVLARRLGLALALLGLAAVPFLLLAVLGLGPRLALVPLSGAVDNAAQLAEWLDLSTRNAHSLGSLLWPRLGDHLAKYPGLGPLLPLAALTALTSARWRWTALPWLATGLVFMLLSLGTELRVGETTLLGLPYRLLPHAVPYFLRFHHPYRCMLAAALCFTVCAAMGLEGLRQQLATRRRWWLALAVVLPLLAGLQVSNMVPLPWAQLPQPGPAFTRLAQEHPTGVVVAIHRRWSHHWNDLEVDPLLGQLEHGAPVCCLSLPRTLWPAGLQQVERDHPLLGALTGPFAEYDDRALPRDDLTALGFSHLLVYTSTAPDPDAPPEAVPTPTTCPACGALEQRFGPPLVEERLDHTRLLVFALSDAEAAAR